MSRSTTPPKKIFNLLPFTTQLFCVAGSSTSIAPLGLTSFMLKGPLNLEFSFHGNSLSRECQSNTHCLSLNSLFKILLSWQALVLSLYSLDDPKVVSCISSSSCNSSFFSSLDLARSKFKNLRAPKALCSNSTGRWHAFPYTI